MAAYRRVYDSHHLQADCQEPGSAPEPYARQSSIGYLYLFICCQVTTLGKLFTHARASVTKQYKLYWSKGRNVLCVHDLHHSCAVCRAALTGKHDALVRRAPGWQGAPDGQ